MPQTISSIGDYERTAGRAVHPIINYAQYVADLPIGRDILQARLRLISVYAQVKWETPAMTAVVVTHAVGNIDTWLKGGADRKELFPKFWSSHRMFRHPDQANRISIVCENMDLAKLKAAMDTAEIKALMAKHTVIDPIEVYIEVDGGS